MRIFTQLWKKQYLLLAFVLLCSVMPAIADDNNGSPDISRGLSI